MSSRFRGVRPDINVHLHGGRHRSIGGCHDEGTVAEAGSRGLNRERGCFPCRGRDLFQMKSELEHFLLRIRNGRRRPGAIRRRTPHGISAGRTHAAEGDGQESAGDEVTEDVHAAPSDRDCPAKPF